MTEIRHIVFDIGKVLIHYDPNLPYALLIPDAERRKWFFDNVCTHDWNIEQDRGRSWQPTPKTLLIAQNIRRKRQYPGVSPELARNGVAFL
jgi:2-haloacid dehalogenase